MKVKVLSAILLTSTLAFASWQLFGEPLQPLSAANGAGAASDDASLYADGTRAINEGRWPDAAGLFDRVAKMHGEHAEGALYWKAYAEAKEGQSANALNTCGELRKNYAKSRWLDECGALEIEIRGKSGHPVSPQAEPDENLKLLALNALMQQDQSQAVPIIEKILSGNQSEELKSRALFVLAQSDSSQAGQMIGAIARSQSGPDLQVRAIRYLGISGDRYSKLLQEIYAGSSDVKVKKAVLQAYMTSGAKEPVLAAARGEKDPELRRAAIHQLGAMGARKELEELYGSTSSIDDKEAILQAFGMAGDSDQLIHVATTEGDGKIRERAIRDLGPFGGEKAGAALVQIYSNEKDPELRRAAIRSMFILGDATDLIALARTETDPDMKRQLVEQLSLMRNKEARDYMLEILNK